MPSETLKPIIAPHAESHPDFDERMAAHYREAFREILEQLRVDVINKHDETHQERSKYNGELIMRAMGFKERVIQVVKAALSIHDVGYNKKNNNADVNTVDDYLGGTKAFYAKHALYGANMVNAFLKELLNAAEEGDARAIKMLTIKSGNGKAELLTEEEINLITEVILNHNDYGKEAEAYNPNKLDKASMVGQIADKSENCYKRVYLEHLRPNILNPDHPDYDPKYYHRCVPWCIDDYELTIDKVKKEMTIRYEVDLDWFTMLMKQTQPDFNYTESAFEQDFLKAYGKNHRIIAEAAGVLLEKQTDQPILNVEFQFASGSVRKLQFSRPDRSIYSQSDTMPGPAKAKDRTNQRGERVA